MSHGISKGGKRNAESTAQTDPNRVKIPNLQACTCPNDPTVTYQNEAARKVRRQKRRHRKQDRGYRKWTGEPLRQSQHVMRISALHPCRHPQLCRPRGPGRMHEK